MKFKTIRNVFAIGFISCISYYVWFVHFNYRFEIVDTNKVYKSAAMPPEKLAEYIEKYHIKTVIDLRDGEKWSKLNSVNQNEIDEESEMIAKLSGVKHVNIPSPQVPTKQTLTKFFDILDNNVSYPVLIHCHHGTGRAEIYSALYRIEYMKISNENARQQTRLITQIPFLYNSSFALNKDKGKFLAEYKQRSFGTQATINFY